jgi:hypothetical protein
VSFVSIPETINKEKQMQAGDKVVCVNREASGLSIGEIFTVERINLGRPSAAYPYNAPLLYLKGNDSGYFDWRFRPLEEMQNTNFISLVQ